MVSSIYILALGFPAAFFAATAFSFSEEHKAWKLLMWSAAYLMCLGMPVAASSAAAANNLTGVKTVMDVSMLPLVSGFILWIFYLYRTFITSSTKTMQGSEDFGEDIPG